MFFLGEGNRICVWASIPGPRMTPPEVGSDGPKLVDEPEDLHLQQYRV